MKSLLNFRRLFGLIEKIIKNISLLTWITVVYDFLIKIKLSLQPFNNQNRFYYRPMKQLIYILIILIPLSSCNKKWKKTSESDFSLNIVKSKSSVDYINITEGSLYLDVFSLDGVRKKGKDVSFKESFDEVRVFDVSSSSITPLLTYDIPQGEYTSLSVNLRYDVYDTIGAMIIKGTFKDSNDLDVPFVFQLEDRIDITILATSSTGGNITIVEGQKSQPVIQLNIIDWFEQIPQGSLEEADASEEDGVEVIHINKSDNYLLYSLILDRIGKTATITF